VDHFDEVAGAVGSDVGDAGLTVNNSGDGLEDRTQGLPRLGRSAGHNRRAEQCALFATGDTGADEVDAGLTHGLLATDGVGEQCVATVDDDVAGLEDLGECGDDGVSTLTGLHHDDGGAGLRERCGELFVAACGQELCLGVLVENRLGLLVRTVVDGDGVAFTAGEVAGEVRPHHRHTDYANVCLCLG
jgi:hypothetical protein